MPQGLPPTVWYVDGNTNPMPGSYPSITAALTNTQLKEGDTVSIVGLLDSNLNPAPYSEATTSEGFPLPVKEGITLNKFGSDPVYIWSSNISAAPDLLDFPDTVGKFLTTITNITLGGGARAASIVTSGSEEKEVLFKSVDFIGDEYGVFAEANGGNIYLQVKWCNYRYVSGGLTFPQRNPTAALSLIAKEGSPDGVIEAYVQSLKVLGTFPDPTPLAWENDTRSANEYELALHGGPAVTAASRVINVSTSGADGEHDVFGNLKRIPKVDLELVNCEIDGKVTGANAPGWDIGLYANCKNSTGGATQDYASAYEISMTGCTIENCALDGIFVDADLQARGSLWLDGTVIRDIGKGRSVGSLFPAFNGVHLYCYEGYLGFDARDSEIYGCSGNGVIAHCPGTMIACYKWPKGLLTKLIGLDIHDNGANGIEFASAATYIPENPSGFGSQGAIVGGTWDDWSQTGNLSITWNAQKNFHIDSGQGVIDRCSVYENGRWGVKAEVQDTFGPELVHARFSNTYIWGNTLGGYKAKVDTDPNDTYLITPFVNCTVADHSNSTWSADVEGPNAPVYLYSNDPYAPAVGDPRTSFLNCIFQQSSPTSDDFSPTLEGLIVSFSSSTSPADKIEIGGDRFWSTAKVVSSYPSCADASTPFAGLADPTLLGAYWYFLNPSGSGLASFKNFAIDALDVDSPESSVDFILAPRPDTASGLRDKGGNEIQ